MDPQPSLPENRMVDSSAPVATSSTLSTAPNDPASTATVATDSCNVAAATTEEGSMPDGTPTASEPNDQPPQQPNNGPVTEKRAPKATFPKQIGNAWGIKPEAEATTNTETVPQSTTGETGTNNTKKRSNSMTRPRNEDSTAVPTIINTNHGNISSKPKFADIMAEQESAASKTTDANNATIASGTKVSFSQEVETEEERMMRLAIEASLQDQQQQQQQQQQQHGLSLTNASKMPPSALRNSNSSMHGSGVSATNTEKTTSFSTESTQSVSFSSSNYVYDMDDDMDDDMRLAIALSLQEAGGGGGADSSSCAAASASAVPGSFADSNNDMEEEDGDRKPSALPIKEGSSGMVEEEEEDRKPAALKMGGDAKPKSDQSFKDIYPAKDSAPGSSFFDSLPAAACAVATTAATSAAAAAPSSPPGDESEKLAQALYEAELAEYNASRSSDADAEAASLQLAMQLQQEEDARHNLHQNAEAARLKREEMCHGGGRAGSVGVRTVGREEFHSLKGDKDGGASDGRMINRRKQEEIGMGKLLSSKNHCFEGVDVGGSGLGHNYDETDDYYYYANDRLKGEDIEQDDIDYEDDDGGIRMNSQSSSTNWKRLDKDTFIGPNNEIRTKHDPELKHRSNAVDLLGSHGAKLKDAYNHHGDSSENRKSVSVSDRAYNAFKRAESRQAGYKKGVAKQGHGRAENMNIGATRGGAMDGNARLHINAAINSGLIDTCNGVVKEGKEALVYHANGGWKGRHEEDGAKEGVASSAAEMAQVPDGTLESVRSDGYDVAVKIFKRISEFKGRGSYVDGDPRYHKQKFKSNDQRNQVVMWTEKEYRNLVRAHRAGVAVPTPLYYKENILFMRFLGDDGWPSPQLKEIDIKKGSDKWTTLYCQTLVAIRRLYHCARLIHADLSEYNLLVCPSWQTSQGHFIEPNRRTANDETLQVVLIDFGQAVEIGHPSAVEWLQRDLATMRDFFVRQGIKTLSNETAEEFVTDPFDETASDEVIPENNEEEADSINEKEDQKTEGPENNDWRHVKRGWDDNKYMDSLLKKLKG